MTRLNINSGSADLRERELSNLQIRPFQLEGHRFRSVEGFLQGIKFPPSDPRREEAFNLAGLRAKRMGERAEGQWIWWNDEQIDYGSIQHRLLLEQGIRASFEQNLIVLLVLLSTRGLELTHEVGQTESIHTSLPAKTFCQILTRLRDETSYETQQNLAEGFGFTQPTLD